MRASEELDSVLPVLRLAFATADRVSDFSRATRPKLPPGWSLTDFSATDGARSVLVACEDDLDGVGFLVSEDGEHLVLHAVVDDTLHPLGRRRAGGLAVLPRARAA